MFNSKYTQFRTMCLVVKISVPTMCGYNKNKIVHLQGKYLNLYIISLILRAWKNNIQTKLQLALNIVLDR